jgi:hypothetical protein
MVRLAAAPLGPMEGHPDRCRSATMEIAADRQPKAFILLKQAALFVPPARIP